MCMDDTNVMIKDRQSDYNHWHYVNLVRMRVQQKDPSGRWLSERRLKYGRETRKRQRAFDIDAEIRQGENHYRFTFEVRNDTIYVRSVGQHDVGLDKK